MVIFMRMPHEIHGFQFKRVQRHLRAQIVQQRTHIRPHIRVRRALVVIDRVPVSIVNAGVRIRHADPRIMQADRPARNCHAALFGLFKKLRPEVGMFPAELRLPGLNTLMLEFFHVAGVIGNAVLRKIDFPFRTADAEEPSRVIAGNHAHAVDSVRLHIVQCIRHAAIFQIPRIRPHGYAHS